MSDEQEIGERILATLLYVLKQELPPFPTFAKGFYETLQGRSDPAQSEIPTEVDEEVTVERDVEVRIDADAEVDEETDEEALKILLTSVKQTDLEPPDEEAARVFLSGVRAVLPYALALSRLPDTPLDEINPFIACWQLRSREDVHVLAELIFNRGLLEVSGATYQNFDAALVDLLRRNPPPVWKSKKNEKAKTKKDDERMRLKKLLLKQGRGYVSLSQSAKVLLELKPERDNRIPIIGLGADRAGISLLSYLLHSVLLFASMPANVLASFDRALNVHLEEKIQSKELPKPDGELDRLLNYLRLQYRSVFKQYEKVRVAANAQQLHPLGLNEKGQFEVDNEMDLPDHIQQSALLPAVDSEMSSYLARLREIGDFIEEGKNRLPHVKGTPFPLYFRLYLASLTLEIMGGQKYFAHQSKKSSEHGKTALLEAKEEGNDDPNSALASAQSKKSNAHDKTALLKALGLTFKEEGDDDTGSALDSLRRTEDRHNIFGRSLTEKLKKVLCDERFAWREEGVPDLTGFRRHFGEDIRKKSKELEGTIVTEFIIPLVRKQYGDLTAQEIINTLKKLSRLEASQEPLDIEQSISLWLDLSRMVEILGLLDVWKRTAQEFGAVEVLEDGVGDLRDSIKNYISAAQSTLEEGKSNFELTMTYVIQKYLKPRLEHDREGYEKIIQALKKEYGVEEYDINMVKSSNKRWLAITESVFRQFGLDTSSEAERGKFLPLLVYPLFTDGAVGLSHNETGEEILLPSREKCLAFLDGTTSGKNAFASAQRDYLLAALMLEEPPQSGPFGDHFVHYRNVYLRVIKDLPWQPQLSEYHKWLQALYHDLAPKLNDESFTGRLQRIG